MQIIASYFLVSARARAAMGISNAPGTRTRATSFFFAPERSNPSYALCKSRSLMKALKRETTRAKRIPAAPSPPSMAGTAGSGGRSNFIFSFVFLSATRRLSGALGSLAFKRRRPLLQKRRSPFLLVFCRATNSKQSSLQKQPLGERHLHPFVDGLYRVLPRQRSVRNDLGRNRLRPRNQLRRRRHFIDQPDAMRFLRRDHLSRQHHLHGKAFAHQPRQPLRPAVPRNNSELHLGLPELRIIARETHGAGERQFASAAKCKSVHAGNHRLAQILDQIEHALATLRILFRRNRILPGQFADIGSSNKRLFADASQNDNADAVVALNVMKRPAQFFDRGTVERVENFGTVDLDVSDRVFLFEKNVFVGHEHPH